MSDLKAVKQNPPEGVSASPISEDNLMIWSATVFGPDDTPWEGGIFSMRLTFNDQYPDKPPRVRFTSEMFHPNIYPDGTLCMDLIQDNWSPIYSVSLHVTSVGALPAAHARSVLGRSRLLKPAPSRLPSRRRARRDAHRRAPPWWRAGSRRWSMR